MDKFNFDDIKEKLIKSNREIMVELSNLSQNYFLSSWKKQGFNGEAWKDVQRREPGTKAYKYPKKKGLQRRTQPILIGSGFKTRGGTLRRAVSNMARTAEISTNRSRMVVDVPYAGYLNEGTDKMVARKFVGQTQELTDKQQKAITKIIDRIWKV